MGWAARHTLRKKLSDKRSVALFILNIMLQKEGAGEQWKMTVCSNTTENGKREGSEHLEQADTQTQRDRQVQAGLSRGNSEDLYLSAPLVSLLRHQAAFWVNSWYENKCRHHNQSERASVQVHWLAGVLPFISAIFRDFQFEKISKENWKREVRPKMLIRQNGLSVKYNMQIRQLSWDKSVALYLNIKH